MKVLKSKIDISQRVVCAMSGGVDSSVAAALLKKHGYDVIGVFLKFWRPSKSKTASLINADLDAERHGLVENTCCNQEALRSARAVAEKLKIPFYVLDVSREFKKRVVDYYISEYDSGRTPNPCVMCNKFIKFGWLLRKAKELGAEYLATGHYIRLRREIRNPKSEILNKFKIQNSCLAGRQAKFKLIQAKDKDKDQSYFLWQLSQNQLKHLLFPIGDYTKQEVRQLAKKFRLPTAGKKESQNVCFVPNDNYSFLKKYAKKLNKPGNITDLKGHILGHHRGLAYYTRGQRHGLNNIQLKTQNSKLKSGFAPAYVVRLDIKNNSLIVGEEKDLYQKKLIASKINWVNPHIAKPINCRAKIRYGHQSENCQIVYPEQSRGAKLPAQSSTPRDEPSSSDSSESKIEGPNCLNTIKVIFAKPQRSITPGQSVVFYEGQELLGGGIIK